MAAWDGDPGIIKDELIDKFSFDFTKNPTVNGTIPSWTIDTKKGKRSLNKCTLQYKYRIYCNTHYYGMGCENYCKDTDSDNGGHYWCATNGSKICFTNWFRPQSNCLKYCSPRNDTGGHYNCDLNGDKMCHPNWYGQNCALFVKNETEGYVMCSNVAVLKYAHSDWLRGLVY